MNTADLKIRQADIFDIESLISLLKVLFSIEEDFAFNEEKQRSGLMQMLENERACVLVAETGGKTIGMCTGQLTISTAEGGAALLVEDVVIQEGFRKQGIGKKLMEEILLWGQEKGVSRMQLLADCNNSAALKFYKSIGWKTTELICLRKLIPNN